MKPVVQVYSETGQGVKCVRSIKGKLSGSFHPYLLGSWIYPQKI